MKQLLGIAILLILMPFAYAANVPTPTFECLLTDVVGIDNVPGPAKTQFLVTTPVIYLFCKSRNVEDGNDLKTIWIADDTQEVAPPKYKVAEKSLHVDENLGDDERYNLSVAVNKPDKDWATGSYHVDFYIDGVLYKVLHYTIVP